MRLFASLLGCVYLNGMRKIFSAFFTLFISLCIAEEQSVTLAECETMFLKNNLHLLAAQYNIEAQKALITQAKLWNNPILNLELNAYNPSGNKRIFDIGRPDGQKAVAIQQLILLGGKRKAQIEIAKSNTIIATYDYQDMMRTLKFQLRKSYFSIYYDSRTLFYINQQINHLDTLVIQYKLQVEKGNTPMRDLVRLRGLVLNLKNSKVELESSVIDNHRILSILTGISEETKVEPTEAEISKYFALKEEPVAFLVQQALEHRGDYKIIEEQTKIALFNLRLQKAFRVPDVTLGVAYDQNGGAFKNQVNATLGIPLILWDRNQGNIRVADFEQKTAQSNLLQKQREIQYEVTATYKKYLASKGIYPSDFKQVRDNFEIVAKGVLDNFKKRNISLLEFTDFIESYKLSVSELNINRRNLIVTQEELNYITATDLF